MLSKEVKKEQLLVYFSGASILNFTQVNAGWDRTILVHMKIIENSVCILKALFNFF